MGLDMYLNGRQYNAKFPRPKDEPKEKIWELGYWRKHPDLHGFIVQTFAEGEDNCQPIELGWAYGRDAKFERLEQLIKAVEEDRLPHTEGFFFGQSCKPGDGPETFKDTSTGKTHILGGYAEQKAEDLRILIAALEWLKNQESDRDWRTVEYQASW